jgi:hypothetical protein
MTTLRGLLDRLENDPGAGVTEPTTIRQSEARPSLIVRARSELPPPPPTPPEALESTRHRAPVRVVFEDGTEAPLATDESSARRIAHFVRVMLPPPPPR